MCLSQNLIINGSFRINQRGYGSASSLAAGAFGHDRWKAGGSGGDYSFTQVASGTEITIAAGKSLIQVIEAANVTGGSYTLSWEGTSPAKARVGINSGTPSGTFVDSPIIISGQSADTVMSVEFEDGDVTNVTLTPGVCEQEFASRPIGEELALCQRYFCKTYSMSVAPGTVTGEGAFMQRGYTGTLGRCFSHRWQFPVEMASAPTVTVYSPYSSKTTGKMVTNSDHTLTGGTSPAEIFASVYCLAASGCVLSNDDYLQGTSTSSYSGIHAIAEAEL